MSGVGIQGTFQGRTAPAVGKLRPWGRASDLLARRRPGRDREQAPGEQGGLDSSTSGLGEGAKYPSRRKGPNGEAEASRGLWRWYVGALWGVSGTGWRTEAARAFLGR